MAKRFTDTNKYKKPFIRSLKGAYKLLWDYLYHDCDHAGIWIVDFEIAQLYIGNDMPVNKSDALKFFNSDEIRIVEFDNGKKWFIPSFIDFQYGELSEENRAHNSVLKILSSNNLINKIKGHTSPLQGAMDKDKDKDKKMDKEKDKEERKLAFAEKVKLFGGGYDSEMLKEFFNYWTESNEGGKKMRFEMEKVFDISKRLTTWNNRKKQFNGKYQNNREQLAEMGRNALAELAKGNTEI